MLAVVRIALFCAFVSVVLEVELLEPVLEDQEPPPESVLSPPVELVPPPDGGSPPQALNSEISITTKMKFLSIHI